MNKKKIKITLASSAGFCFGVTRALEIAEKTVKSPAPVYMLGDIVHNETVINHIKSQGIKKISSLGKKSGATLLIRAHGTGKTTIEKALRRGYKIVDATCPMVKEIHQIAQNMEKKGYHIVIIGDEKHDEVRGIIGQLENKPTVIQKNYTEKLDLLRHNKKIAIVVQSTQNPEEVTRIVNEIKKLPLEVKFKDTICNPTKIKQNETRKLPLENDAMIVIGSKTSANTKRLFEISRSLNKKTFWINSAKEIKKRWFDDVFSVGITAGASTPNSTIREIISAIRRLSN